MATWQAKRVLTGDVGGTNARLRLVTWVGTDAQTVVERVLPSRDFQNLASLLQQFLVDAGPQAMPLAAVTLGIAAPVVDGVAKTTNLPWPEVSEASLGAALGVPVRLLNDLQAIAWGLLATPNNELLVLQPGVARTGPLAVIAPGTGLGQAVVWQADGRMHVQATEGGHTDFAPADEDDVALWRFARAQLQTADQPNPHVSWERLVSGPGLVTIWQCLTAPMAQPACPEVTSALAAGLDAAAVIGGHGVTGTCPTCVRAVHWLGRLLGAQAGNLALTVWSVGGVYVAGGLTDKLWPVIASGPFVRGFTGKGRYAPVLGHVPVYASRSSTLGLDGAALVVKTLV